MKLNVKTALLAATAVSAIAVTAAPAQALRFSVEGPNTRQFTNEPGATTIDFDAILPGAVGVTESGGSIIPAGTNQTTEFRRPTNNVTAFFNVTGAQRTASFTFGTALRYFGLYWGSVDSYNSIRFFNSNNAKIGEIVRDADGSILPFAGIRGNDLGVAINSRDSFFLDVFAENFLDPTADGFDAIKRVELVTGSNSFEVDNLAFANVPTPGLLPGLVGMGVAAWRKRKQGGAEAAES